MAPALLEENLDVPPSSSMETNETAPLRPQGSLELSTVTENSLPSKVNIAYFVESAMRYSLGLIVVLPDRLVEMNFRVRASPLVGQPPPMPE